MVLKKIQTAGDVILQNIQDAIARALVELENRASYLGEPTNVKTEQYFSKFGEIVICDPITAGFTVALPKIEGKDIGKAIYVINATASTNTITIRPDGDGTINGSATDTITTGYGNKKYIAITNTKWVGG